MKDKLEAIRQKCVKANPKIAELTFGCELAVGDSGRRRFFTGENKEDSEWFFVELDQVGCEDEYYYREGPSEDINKAIIIGRPIHLADILVAIDVDQKVKSINNLEYLSNEMEHLWSVAKGLIHKWNLRQDDLEKQSPETIDFIANVLGV